jgi:site-specific recombinase XerD
VFVLERGAALSPAGFSPMVERAVADANLGIKGHAHMLRCACGYKLANDGVDTRSLHQRQSRSDRPASAPDSDEK